MRSEANLMMRCFINNLHRLLVRIAHLNGGNVPCDREERVSSVASGNSSRHFNPRVDRIDANASMPCTHPYLIQLAKIILTTTSPPKYVERSMDLFNFGPEWVQVGELGLAFVVVLLCSGLVLFVIKTSARREHDYLDIIKTVLPVMEKMSVSMSNINLRLENIEENQVKLFENKALVKPPRRRSTDVATRPIKTAKIALPITEVPSAKVD
jgi:hypothetical protein